VVPVVTSAWKCWPLRTLPTIHSLIDSKAPRTNRRTDETLGFFSLVAQPSEMQSQKQLVRRKEGVHRVWQMTERV
jgi:hypothetical protein